jgi:hypothetical protein
MLIVSYCCANDSHGKIRKTLGVGAPSCLNPDWACVLDFRQLLRNLKSSLDTAPRAGGLACGRSYIFAGTSRDSSGTLKEIAMTANVIVSRGLRMGVLVAALAVGFRLGPALAQEHATHEGSGQMGGMGGMMMGGMQMGGGMDHEAMMGRMMCRMAEHVEGKLAYIKAELKITDAQAPQWNAFADAFRATRKKAAQHCPMMKGQDEHKEHAEHGRKAAPSLLERLDKMEQHVSARLEALRSIKGPLQALYAVLSDEQKKTADQVIKGSMGMM